MLFDFLGYSCRVLAEHLSNTETAHLVIQGVFDELSFLGSQVFVFSHSRYLLKSETQQKKNNTKKPERPGNFASCVGPEPLPA